MDACRKKLKTQRGLCVWAGARQVRDAWWEDTLDLESVSSSCLSRWTMGQKQVSPSPQLSSVPHLVSWRASPMRHEPGAGRSDGQAWHLNPCPEVLLGAFFRGRREVHLSREKEKQGLHTEAHPTNSLLLGPALTPTPPPAEILSVSVRWGSHCAPTCRWRKEAFGGKQFSCPLGSQWGHIPLLRASVRVGAAVPAPHSSTVHTCAESGQIPESAGPTTTCSQPALLLSFCTRINTVDSAAVSLERQAE